MLDLLNNGHLRPYFLITGGSSPDIAQCILEWQVATKTWTDKMQLQKSLNLELTGW